MPASSARPGAGSSSNAWSAIGVAANRASIASTCAAVLADLDVKHAGLGDQQLGEAEAVEVMRVDARGCRCGVAELGERTRQRAVCIERGTCELARDIIARRAECVAEAPGDRIELRDRRFDRAVGFDQRGRALRADPFDTPGSSPSSPTSPSHAATLSGATPKRLNTISGV